jgi:hypothetical protein
MEELYDKLSKPDAMTYKLTEVCPSFNIGKLKNGGGKENMYLIAR